MKVIMKIKIKKNEKYSELVNFKKNKIEKIHRWFNIKEGYSKDLVNTLIDDLKITDGYIVDFFNGSGTTTLVAKERGYKYFGFEISPFLYMLSKVKLDDYSEGDVSRIIKEKNKIFDTYQDISNVDNIKLTILQNVFRGNIEDILKIRKLIFNIKDEKTKNFFIISMISILEIVGYAKKDGNGLKYPKNKKINKFVDVFFEKVDSMLLDLNDYKYKNNKESNLILCDSRNISKDNLNYIKNKTSLIVFSPPYANCFDYSEVYKLELWLGGFVKEYKDLIKIRDMSLSSHLNKNLDLYKEYPIIKKDLEILKKKKLWSKKIPQMLSGYFYDMEKILINSFDILKKGGYCVIIVGNSAYSGHIIETDVVLSKIAQKIGFSSIEINVTRKLRASSQQAKLFKNDNSLRESVIIIKK
jgi:SAM-dependent methyltransferase